MHRITTLTALLTFSILSSLNATSQANDKNLVEFRAGNSDYYISLPKNYTLKQNQGPDFSVFYFMPEDTNAQAKYAGGFYLGDYPNRFGPESDSCMTTTMGTTLLDSAATWTVYECRGFFTLQTVIETGPNGGWGSKVHAFGSAASKADMDKVLAIYATLKYRPGK
jgi:hypothetical protein